MLCSQQDPSDFVFENVWIKMADKGIKQGTIT